MKKLLGISILLLSCVTVLAEEAFCKKPEGYVDETYDGFNISFCFATEEFMKGFVLRLYEDRIPFVVHTDGSIGYRDVDRGHVKIVGDELVNIYLARKYKN